MLASIFIFGGINELRDAEGHAQVAKPFLDKTVGGREDSLPDSVPTDPQTLVKIDAAVKIGAGTMLALGKAPRLAATMLIASLVPTTAAGHPFWESEDPAEKQAQLVHFLKNAGLAGGLMIAAADTHGKPSVNWRAQRAAKKAGNRAHETAELTRKEAKKARKRLPV
jgi:uncharacterized membrane protein YphA (DoxX/SURF4 family)